MTQSTRFHRPCPLCGRITRAHSRLQLRDVERAGTARASEYSTLICRDCAFAMVLRAEASGMAV